jgi:hypothetical protein
MQLNFFIIIQILRCVSSGFLVTGLMSPFFQNMFVYSYFLYNYMTIITVGFEVLLAVIVKSTVFITLPGSEKAQRIRGVISPPFSG